MPGRAPSVEPLEPRVLLSAEPAGLIAHYQGEIVEAGESAVFEAPLQADTITGGAHGAYRLGLSVLAESDDGFDPAAIEVRRADGTAVFRQVAQDDSFGADSFVLLDLAPDDYTFTVFGENDSTGRFTLQAALVGDMDGDGSVAFADRVELLNAQRQRRVDIDSDTNRDGRVYVDDIANQMFNFGAVASVAPLSLTLGLDADGGVTVHPDGGLVVTDALATLSGVTSPSATVTFDSDGDGFDAGDPTVAADPDGRFSFAASLLQGSQTLDVRAVDPGAMGQVQRASLEVTRTPAADTTPPSLTANLIEDTGDGGDGLTRVPVIAGSADDGLSDVMLRISLNGAAPVDVTASLQPDGGFTLDLDTLGAGPLPDGAVEALLTATDEAGNTAATTVAFDLDRSAPALSLTLDPASDTGDPGDGVTAATPITITGQTEAGLTVTLLETGETTVADATGGFDFTSVTLDEGLNTYTAEVTDPAGNTAQASTEITFEPGLITLVEDARFVTEFRQAVTVPDPPSALVVTFDQPVFDPAGGPVNDAFEVALLDDAGRPLLLPFATSNDASPTALFNLSEGEPERLGPNALRDADMLRIDLSNLPAGLTGTLVLRLVNNDGDTTSSVRIRSVEIVTTDLDTRAGVVARTRTAAVGEPVDFDSLSELDDLLTPDYRTTTLKSDSRQLLVDVALNHRGDPGGAGVTGPLLLAVGNLSDPSVTLANQDGTTPAGLPFVRVDGDWPGRVLDPGESTAPATLVFDNPDGVAFTFDLVILGQLNRAPRFVSDPPRHANVGEPFIHEPVAQDPDDDPLTFALPVGPAAMSIDPSTGLLEWTPEPGDVGAVSLLIEVTDGRGGRATQSITLDVQADPLNRPPVITSSPVVDAQVNAGYRYAITATDADGDPLTYALTDAPAGMRIDAATGEIAWSPINDQRGPRGVSVTVRDNDGGEATQAWTINVAADAANRLPVFISTPTTTFNLPGDAGAATGEVDPVTLDLQLDPGEMVIRDIAITLPDDASSVGFADVVITIDESGSMAGEQAFIAETVIALNAALEARGIGPNRFALGGFAFGGDRGRGGYVFDLNQLQPIIVDVYAPDGSLVHSRDIRTDALFDGRTLDLVLPVDGDYTFAVRSDDDAPGLPFERDVTVVDVPELVVDGLDQTRQVTLAPGETETLQFTLNAGMQVYLDSLTAETNSPLRAKLTGPGGQVLFEEVNLAGDVTPVRVPETGPYTLELRILASATEAATGTLRLLDALAFPLTFAAPISGTLGIEEARVYHFQADAFDRVYFENLGDAGARWGLFDPTGERVLANLSGFENITRDLEARLTAPGVYTLVVRNERSDAAMVDFQFVAHRNEVASNELNLGQTVAGTIDSPGDIARFRFDGARGQRLYYDGYEGVEPVIVTPSGEQLGLTSSSDKDTRFPITLAETGPHDLVFDARFGDTGSFTGRLLDLDDAPTPLTLDTPVAGTFTEDRQTHLFELDLAVGQRVNFDGDPATSSSIDLVLFNDQNEAMFSRVARSDQVFEAPAGGTYLLAVRSEGVAGDSYAFVVETLPPATGAAPTPDPAAVELAIGDAVAGDLAAAGEVNQFFFEAEVGDVLLFDGLGSDDPGGITSRWTDPTGEVIFTEELTENELIRVTRGGTYLVEVFGERGDETGSYGFALQDVLAAPTLAIDDPQSVQLTDGMESRLFKLPGQAGRTLLLDRTASTGFGTIILWDGDLDVLDSRSFTGDILAVLPSNDDYYIEVRGRSNGPASLDFTAHTPTDHVKPLTLGEATSGQITLPGDRDVYTFAGAAGQRVYLDALESDNGFNYTLRDELNRELVSDLPASPGGDDGPVTLPDDGVYRLFISRAGGPGSYAFRLHDVDTAPSAGDGLTGTILNGQAEELFTLAGRSGQIVQIELDQAFGTAREFSDAAGIVLGLGGGVEDGYDAIAAALELDFRPGAARNVILVTDEDRDVINDDLDFASTLALVQQNNVLLNMILDADLETGAGATAIGLDAEGAAYVADGAGGFTTMPGGQATGGFENTLPDYIDLAFAQDGVVFDLKQLREGGDLAESFAEVFIDVAADSIVRQFGGISVLASDAEARLENLTGEVEGVGPNETATFTVKLTGDGVARTFELLLVRTESGEVLGSLPVTLRNDLDDIARVFDADGDPITFSLLHAPAGATIDPATGQLDFVPDTPGVFDFTIQADDGAGGVATQSYQLTVTRGRDNMAPMITSTPPTNATVGLPLAYTVRAEDADGDGLSFLLDSAPAGATIDTSTGELTFTPGPGQIGAQTLAVRVIDGQGGEATQAFTLDVVADSANRRPEFISLPPDEAPAGDMLRYQATATDADADPLRYDLAVGPDGMAVVADSGLVTWTPTDEQTGVHRVIVRAVDGRGGVALQSFELTTPGPNTAPVITSTPPLRAVVGQPFVYQVLAQDAEGDGLTFRLDAAPDGMLIDGSNGRIQFTPAAGQLGEQAVTLAVRDTRGAEASQTFTIDVQQSLTNAAPVITSTPRTSTQLGAGYTYQIEATDPDSDELAFSLEQAPAGMTVTRTGLVQWTPAPHQFGSQEVTVRVSDVFGAAVNQAFTLTVRSQVDNTAPRFVSTPPDAAAVGRTLVYDLAAIDAENDSVFFQPVEAPAGVSLDSATGRLRWTPTVAQVGEQRFTIEAVDALGARTEQTFAIVVTTRNTPPTIVSTPGLQAGVGHAYRYQVAAEDIDGDPLTFTLTEAPDGMAIDASGLITWTPAADPSGLQDVRLVVDDERGGEAVQAFSIGVAASLNQPPRIHSVPMFAAETGRNWTYQVEAIDPEGQPLGYELEQAPAGMSIDPVTGFLRWEPAAAHLGANAVAVVVTDAAGDAATQRFSVTVVGAASNAGPSIDSAPPSNAVALGGRFVYDLRASDPDGDRLSLALDAAPDGMTLSPTGRLLWTPEPQQLGAAEVAVVVTDPFGAFASQSFTLDVIADDTAPNVSVQVSDNPVDPATPVIITVQASDNVGVQTVDLAVNGEALALSRDLTATFTPTTTGRFEVVATATDASGNVADRAITLNVTDTSDVEAPLVFIESPEPGDVIDNLIDVVGAVTDDNLAFYSLGIAELGSDQFTEIARGDTEASGEVLGQFDPTILQNGAYRLRLLAEDLGGLQSSDVITVDVTGDLKIGAFTTTFIDLSIPLSGVPIQIARTYDTLQSTQVGEFGFGWRLEIADADLRTNLPNPGQEGDLVFQGFKPGTRVFVTLPGGEREGFTFQPVPDSNLGAVLGIFRPHFVPDPGVTTTLSVERQQLRFNPALGEFQSYAGLLPYNPAAPAFGGGYTLTREDGTVFNIDGVTGDVRTVTDRNANVLTYTDAGIVSSSCLSIDFERDARGRITAIVDPDGDRITYRYDANGDLVAVTDREANLTRFTYLDDRPHFLEEVIDPLGRTGITNEYDDQGRIIRQLLADGTDVHLVHDPDNQVETRIDRNGEPTLYEYDTRGNIVTTVDAEGGVTRFTYDPNNHPLTRTNAEGETVTFTYDRKGYVLSETNGEGETITFTRNEFGDILTRTDALGHTTAHEYDDAGNRTRTIDALGQATTWTFDEQGNPTSMTDALGQTTTMQHNASGYLTRMVDPRGHVTEYTHDDSGNTLTETRTRTVDGAPVQVVTRYEYDDNGLRIRTIDAAGVEHRMEYNGNLDVTAQVDGNGGRSEIRYDDFGFVEAFAYPDGTEQIETVNGEGYLTATTDRAGRVTGYENDALNRLTRIVEANGVEKHVAYDAVGRITQAVNGRGAERNLEYDNAGRVIRTVDALGGETTHTYDAAGRELTRTDARGNTTSYSYDALSRRILTTFPDDSTIAVTYDALDRRISQTDQLGRTTRFEYDATGNLTRVIDAAGAQTTFTYDELGNQLTRTDALGRTTAWTYDNLGRVLTHTRPLGQTESFVYDGVGNIIEHTDFNGATHTFTYDALHRIRVASFADGEIVRYTYTPTGRIDTVTDGRGLTDHTYDDVDRLTRVDHPDGTFIAYAYDEAGNARSIATPSGVTRYTYDLLDRVQTVTGADGGVTTYDFDAVGNLTSRTLPNGAKTTYAYDMLDRVIRISHETSDGDLIESFVYQRNAYGAITQVVEGSGDTVTYVYDALNRLTEERLDGPGRSERITTWTYDAVGNRLTETTDSVTVTSRYNANDQLTARGDATFTYDGNGNQTSRTESGDTVTYTYDSQNRMVSVDDGAATTTYTYDFGGNLVATARGGDITVYLLDVRGNPRVIEQRDGAGTLQRRYERGHDRELISQTHGGRTHYFHRDQLGSTRALTDAAQLVTDTFRYEAFGSLDTRTGTTQVDHLFNGQKLDTFSGLYDLRARYYNPAIGRFMSTDPFAGDDADPATLHRYLYVHNDPVNGSDASGLFFSSLVDFAVANAALTQTFTMMATTVVKAIPITAASIIFYRPALEMRLLAIEWIAGTTDTLAGLNGALQMMDVATRMFAVGQKVQNATDKLIETAEAGLGVGQMALSIKLTGAPPEAFELKQALTQSEATFEGFMSKVHQWADGQRGELKSSAINMWNETRFAHNLYKNTETIITNFGDTDITDGD